MWAELVQDGGQDGTVVTAICYELGGLGFEPWWGKIFQTHPDQSPRPTQPPVQCAQGLFPQGKAVGVWN